MIDLLGRLLPLWTQPVDSWDDVDAAFREVYADDPGAQGRRQGHALAHTVDEVGRHGCIVSDSLHQALRKLAASCRDIRLSDTLEETLTLLETGMSDREIAGKRQLSVRTIEDHKRKILEIFGTTMEARHQGFAGLSRDLGIQPGDLVNDLPASSDAHRNRSGGPALIPIGVSRRRTACALARRVTCLAL